MKINDYEKSLTFSPERFTFSIEVGDAFIEITVLNVDKEEAIKSIKLFFSRIKTGKISFIS